MRVIVLNNELALVNGRDGYFLVNRHDLLIGRSLETYGEWGGNEGQILASLVRPGEIVIEAGANIGAFTVGLAKKVGPQGKVFAYEPQRACFALLQSQIALNELNNVYAYNIGIGAEESTLFLPRIDYSHEGNFGGISLATQEDELHYPVPVKKLDDLFPELPIALIKADVEGMEHDVLIGAKNLIARCKPVLYLENDRKEKSSALISLILELGYRIWWSVTDCFSPNNFFNAQQNICGCSSFNILCLHTSKIENADTGMQEITSPDCPWPIKS